MDLTKRASRSASTFEEEDEEGSFDDDDYYNLLKVPDYHACDNLQRVDHSAHTLSDSQDLPAYRYGSNIFVREDFRNMISQVTFFILHNTLQLIFPTIHSKKVI